MLLNDLVIGCDCEDLAKFSANTALILDEGDIPLISIPVNGRLCISRTSLSEGESTLEFAAISHVRSQSLVIDNGPNMYSLRRLQSLVDGLPKPSAVPSQSRLGFPWWIDILCIPEGLRENTAKAKIKKIFQAATAVLVLDSELCHWVPASSPDCCSAIRQSLWMKRLWTLQEAALAQRVYFRFFEKTISLADIIGSRESAFDGTEEAQMSTAMEVNSLKERNEVHDKLECLDRFDEDLKSIDTDWTTSSDDVKSMEDVPDAGSCEPLNNQDDRRCTSKVNRNKLNKYRLRSLLRLGYLSLPWFQLISDRNEYIRSQAVMAKIVSLYGAKSETGQNTQLYISKGEKLRALEALDQDTALEDRVG